MKPENIIAFDFHPLVSTVLMDHWRRFDEISFRAELAAAKAAHPGANAVRITLSYDAYLRDPREYGKLFEKWLSLCAEQELGVICCLFNRWHDRRLDCGGVYLESMIPGLSWAYKEGFFAPFLADVVQDHEADERIVLWETCNKPYGAYTDFSAEIVENHRYELRWLRELYCFVKQTGTKIPAAVSLREWFGPAELAEMADCCDLFLKSPYYANEEMTEKIKQARWEGSPLPIVEIQA